MPLNVATLTAQLTQLDDPGKESKDIPSAAQAWAEAWWAYASQHTFISPAALLAKPTIVSAFALALTPGLAWAPLPAFFAALELAMRAGWSPTGLGNPLYLMPPPPAIVSITPAPAPFTPIGVAVATASIAVTKKEPVRAALAAAIHGWTITHTVSVTVPPAGAVVSPLS